MAKTLGDMKARIAAEIFRGDLTSQIENAIRDAIDTYQGDRFWFNEPSLVTEPTFNTVIGQATYDATAQAQIGLMYNIDYLTYAEGNTVFEIIRRSPKEIELLNQIGQIAGPPTAFTYAGAAISLYPTPSAVYTIKIFGHINVAAPVDDTEDNNVWMNACEKLIRSRAKFELATHVTRNDKMAQTFNPANDAGPTALAFRELKGQTNKLTSLGRIQAMQF
jgi:hypothetical protein